jgi:AmmeMemoRadiSam system protein A
MAITSAYLVPHPPLIFPEIGKGQEKIIQATIESYTRTGKEIAASAPDTIVILSPHSVMYADYFHISPGESAQGDMADFNASNVRLSVAYDTEFIASLCECAREENFPAGIRGEKNPQLDHATMIPLRFIGNGNYKIVRIGVSALTLSRHFAFGKMIAQVSCALNKKTVFIASGDLSHKLKDDGPYGFASEGPVFDAKITDIIRKNAISEIISLESNLCEKAGECGLRPLAVMAGSLAECVTKSELYSYEGPFGVGYAVARFLVTGAKTESAYVRLARSTVELFAQKEIFYQPDFELPPELTQKKAGVFVSIKKLGTLRGCIGTIMPTQKNIAQEIQRNAISASTQDPRFDKINKDELKNLSYSVDVLEQAEPVQNETELDPKKYGVIVTHGFRRGLLLPDLEGVDTVEEQISIAMRKAGIPLSERNSVQLERFLVTRYF